MWLRWFPWRFILRRVARSRGFLDPILVWSWLRRFAQPSEVGEPVELLRAGVVFHTRGLLNSRAIQHNLDWIWPYWVERQFNPLDDAFVPRAFSITHVNLTHRNWTAVGLPDCPALPIVDPRGLLTPYFDGWSLDAWVMAGDGRLLIPSRLSDARQTLEWGDGLNVRTESRLNGLTLVSAATVELVGGEPVCRLRLRAEAESAASLVVALRPYNPEGVSFVHDVTLEPSHRAWRVNGKHRVEFSDATQQHAFSHYRDGDVFRHLPNLKDVHSVTDEIGMATAAVLFALEPGREREVTLSVPLGEESRHEAPPGPELRPATWGEALRGVCALRLPDERIQFLYDAALRTMILHSPGDVYPGPYTYKRFWFRDAAFILHGMLCAGMTARAERVLDRFPARQSPLGFFHSQEGEWDSNGEALWIMRRFGELTGRPPRPEWERAVRLGARWIRKKRLPESDAPHAGLLPAGFSAEHLGLNDYYYWDDFWSVAGLRAAAAMVREYGDARDADKALREADSLMRSIERSLERATATLGRPAMPASPYRRLDAGAIGSLAAGYPLGLFAPGDPRLVDTALFLCKSCFVAGGFFQDMIHSGINPYLSLHVAQVLLRAGDPRAFEILKIVAELASPTGQWPEAIHPRTRGGCMGDGQHVWAAAEWFLMLRNCFVREEGADTLILASGIAPKWLEQACAKGETIEFGPAPTSYGDVLVRVRPTVSVIDVKWEGRWRATAPRVEVRLPGHAPHLVLDGRKAVQFERARAA